MERKKGYFGVGSLWMMIVFVLVCLIVFATLAVLIARRDVLMTKETLKSIEDFYAADAKALEILAAIDHVVAEGTAETSIDQYQVRLKKVVSEAYGFTVEPKANNQLEATYNVPSGERQELFVRVQLNIQNKGKMERYKKLEWVLQPIEGLEYEGEEIEFDELSIGG